MLQCCQALLEDRTENHAHNSEIKYVVFITNVGQGTHLKEKQ